MGLDRQLISSRRFAEPGRVDSPTRVEMAVPAAGQIPTTTPSYPSPRPERRQLEDCESLKPREARNVGLAPKNAYTFGLRPETAYRPERPYQLLQPSSNSKTPTCTAKASGDQALHLLQLSQVAAAHERIQPDEQRRVDEGHSKKRTADGAMKHDASSITTNMGGHSRAVSSVSVPSTNGSRISEISSELKAKLSYAMMKVNNGWHLHTIDQVETLAQAASPASSTSTVRFRNGASTSPQLSAENTPGLQFGYAGGRFIDSPHRESPQSPVKKQALAPPVTIQPATQTRRTSTSHGPLLSPSDTYPSSENLRTPHADPILFSPHQNVREQDAIDVLLTMGSPGNTHRLGSSSQPLSTTGRSAPDRTALPSSQPATSGRKMLPSGRPVASHSHLLSQPASLTRGYGHARRVGSGKSLSTRSDVEGDERRRRSAARLLASAGTLGGKPGRRPLTSEELDRRLDAIVAEREGESSEESDGEIMIPGPGARGGREGVGIGGLQ